MSAPIRPLPAALVLAVLVALSGAAYPQEKPSSEGLQALYDFAAAEGPVVSDRSGNPDPADLRIADMKAVKRGVGALEITGKALIRSERGPANRIADAIRGSGEISLEAWVRPANATQEGPARILTLSKDTSERNFTLGQEKDRFDFRIRSTKTDRNGMPSVQSPGQTAQAATTHIVATRDRSGQVRIYLNGRQSAAGNAGGDLQNWTRDFQIALANEHSGERPWLGTLFLVAIYSRALGPDEVMKHFEAGAEARVPALLAQRKEAESARLFHDKIAPILAQHCLECHDTGTRKGKLDLSLKSGALAGGKSGKALVAGKPDESLLWESVHSDEMPEDRDPLSSEEKEALRHWIETGASFPVDSVDPLAHKRDRRAAQNFVRRLTVPEYIATVRAATGVDIEKEAREILPQDLRADGFSNTAYNLNIDLKHVEAYAQLAEIIVSKMDVMEFAGRFSKNRSLTDDPMIPHVAAIGKWLLRGPLDTRESAVYRGISTSVAAAGGDFEEAITYIVQAMLQAPRFIYLIENQVGDGTEWLAGDFELASRASYTIWGAPPDKELFDAAEKGQLKDAGKLAAQVDRMLADPRAIDRSLHFIGEWLDLDRLENLRPNKDRFPKWNPALAADMRNETLAFFREIAWVEKRPLADLFNAQFTFLSPALAEHYGIKTDPRPGADVVRISLDTVPSRGGLLTQGSVLTMGGDGASMVTRGLFVLHDILRSGVTDPPPGTDTTPVPSKPGLTQRGVALERIASADCGKCHSKFEPLAFGLEKFDGLGTFRESDEFGNRLREDGEVLFPGTPEPVPYQSASELMDLLAASARARESITWKVAQFALGRPLVASDEPILRQIHKSTQKNGGTYAALIKAIVLSDLVRKTRTEAG